MTKKDNNHILPTKISSIIDPYKIAKKLGIKNIDNIYSWFKYHYLKWIIDWLFYGKYYFINNDRHLRSKEFREYYLNKICHENLVKNLDHGSIQIINRYFNIVNMEIWNVDLCLPKLCISENPFDKQIKWNIKAYTKDFYFPMKWCSVFFYKHWINYIPNINEYTQGKDIIDCGAFIWDSALMLNKELEINKIFCCEPEDNNYKKLIKVIEKNNLNNKIIPLKTWVWSKKWEINFDWGESYASKISHSWGTTIKIDSIDNIVKENNINPWLIKWDVEWAEYESILWAEKTIKKYKPDLLISIYHTPKDFFEIKPLLESWGLWYKFKIVHCAEPTCIREIMLLAYIDNTDN